MPVFYPIIKKTADPNLQEKTATENGEVTADEGFDGLSKVVVAVPADSGGVKQYRFNGMTLPELPKIYSYNPSIKYWYIDGCSDEFSAQSNGVFYARRLWGAENPLTVTTIDGAKYVHGLLNAIGWICRRDDDDWLCTGLTDVDNQMIRETSESNVYWANHDIKDADGTIYVTASEPVAVES